MTNNEQQQYIYIYRWIAERRHFKYVQNKRLERLEETKRIYHREREQDLIRNRPFGRDGRRRISAPY